MGRKILKSFVALILLLVSWFGVYLFGIIPFGIEALILIGIPFLILRGKKRRLLIKCIIIIVPIALWLVIRIQLAMTARQNQLEMYDVFEKEFQEYKKGN